MQPSSPKSTFRPGRHSTALFHTPKNRSPLLRPVNEDAGVTAEDARSPEFLHVQRTASPRCEPSPPSGFSRRRRAAVLLSSDASGEEEKSPAKLQDLPRRRSARLAALGSRGEDLTDAANSESSQSLSAGRVSRGGCCAGEARGSKTRRLRRSLLPPGESQAPASGEEESPLLLRRPSKRLLSDDDGAAPGATWPRPVSIQEDAGLQKATHEADAAEGSNTRRRLLKTPRDSVLGEGRSSSPAPFCSSGEEEALECKGQVEEKPSEAGEAAKGSGEACAKNGFPTKEEVKKRMLRLLQQTRSRQRRASGRSERSSELSESDGEQSEECQDNASPVPRRRRLSGKKRPSRVKQRTLLLLSR